MFLTVFRHTIFVNGFLILVKELGLLTNLGQWIRVFGCRKILYVFCIVNNEEDEWSPWCREVGEGVRC
jgi:hypothetical protein